MGLPDILLIEDWRACIFFCLGFSWFFFVFINGFYPLSKTQKNSPNQAGLLSLLQPPRPRMCCSHPPEVSADTDFLAKDTLESFRRSDQMI